jgi:hypothetical protein
MTGMVTVRLILYGLIAFVPNAKDSPSAMHALLVDASGPQYASDGCRIPPHTPVLYAQAGKCRIGGRPCAISDQVERPIDKISGAWRLNRENLGIEIIAPGRSRVRKLEAVQNEKTASVVPSSAAAMSSLHWVPAMQTLLAATAPGKKAGVDPDCLGEARECPIAARLTLDDGRVTSCHMAEEPQEERVYPFEFKPLTSQATPALVQAMSDAVMVTFEVPRGSKVQIVSFDLENPPSWKAKPKRTVVLEDGGEKTIDIWIANVPSYLQPMVEDHACHDAGMSIDRHFELYYNLLADRVPFAQRTVPHRLMSSLQSVLPPSADQGCPLLTFRKPAGPGISPESFRAVFQGGRVPNDWKSCGNIQLAPPGS